MKTVYKWIGFVATMSLLLLLLAGCSKNAPIPPAPKPIPNPIKKPNVHLTVWCSEEDQKTLKATIPAFQAKNADTEWDISFEVVVPSDLVTKYSESPATAAHVFVFSDAQLPALLDANALHEVVRNKDSLIAANAETAIAAATSDKKLFAYPLSMAGDAVLYYDKSILSEDAVKSMDGLLAAAAVGRKKVALPFSDPTFTATFFLSAGNKLEKGAKKMICDFNNASGEQVGEALKTFLSNKSCQTNRTVPLVDGFMDGTLAAGISNVSESREIKSALGENYGVAMLPTFKVGNKDLPLQSFFTYSFVGVKKENHFPIESMMLAEWLSNEAMQTARFRADSILPTNLQTAASADFTADLAHLALFNQTPHALHSQAEITSYTAPLKAFTTALTSKTNEKTTLELLDVVVAAVLAGN